MKTIYFFFLSCALGSAHPSIHSQVHFDVDKVAIEIDSRQLTATPMLKIADGLKDLSAPAGRDITLRCSALYTPAATIYWTFNGKLIQGSIELNLDEKMQNIDKPIVEMGTIVSTYTIACPTSEDSGLYKCIASNGHKTVESAAEVEIEGDNNNCKPTRHGAPNIVEWTEARFEMEGNTATLLCRSDKPAKFLWTFQNKLITSNDRYEILPHGDLIVKNIKWTDLGSYYCTATNANGENEVETFLYPTEKHSL